MGNSHGTNSATASRTASAAAQAGSRTPSEAEATRALTQAQAAAVRAARIEARTSEESRQANLRVRALQSGAFDYEAQHAAHAADVRAAVRQGRTSAPELVTRLQEARATVRQRIAEARHLQTEGQRLQNALQRTPTDAATRATLRQVSRDLGHAQIATGRATLEQGQAEQRLIDAVLGDRDSQSRVRQAAEASNVATARFIAARDTAMQAQDAVRQAESRLDLARGGTGILSQNSATERQALASAAGVFNRAMSVQDFGKMVGARAGETVRVSSGGAGLVHVSYHGSDRSAEMSFARSSGGKLTAHVDWASTARGTRSATTGRDLLRDMASMHRDFGVQRVEATAGKSSGTNGMNGYYTWAKMGFTGRLSSAVSREASTRFGRSITSVQQVMQQPGGSQWWKAHGEQFAATFDWSNRYSVGAFERLSAAANRHGGGS